MFKIILFGDSIFAGYKQGFTSTIFKDMIQRHFPKTTVVNAAMPGATTNDAQAWLTDLVLDEEPDLVVQFFGANDCSSTNYITPDLFQEQTEAIAQVIGPDKVLLVSPPYSDGQRLGDRNPETIARFVQASQQAAADLKMPWVNLFEAMLQTKNPNALLQADGIHFTQTGYDLLSHLICRGIEAGWHIPQ
ncbi:MAG: GDSL-type esterase/lipase family protein [Lactobacillus sp.]|nr:GDSL-type esterase/lipase family protein [Lactobacillus sp.]